MSCLFYTLDVVLIQILGNKLIPNSHFHSLNMNGPIKYADIKESRAGSLAVRRGFLTLTLTLSHSLPLYPTLSLTHSISVSLYHSFSLSLSRSFSHSLSRSNFLHNFLLMTFGTTFILIPKLKSCILTYRHIDIRTY